MILASLPAGDRQAALVHENGKFAENACAEPVFHICLPGRQEPFCLNSFYTKRKEVFLRQDCGIFSHLVS